LDLSAVFWDLDGVLVRTETFFFEATREVMAGLDSPLHRSKYCDQYLADGIDPLRDLVARRNYPDSLFWRYHRQRNGIYKELLSSADIIVEGAEKVVEQLPSRYILAVVTGSKREHFDIIASRLGLFSHFSFSVTGDDVARTKPAADCYLKAIEKADCLPSECLAIEDSAIGLRAAKSAGVNCWVVPNTMTADADFELADKVMADISAVTSFLELATE